MKLHTLILAALVGACSSGGGEGSLQTATMTGTVVELDDQIADRSGVEVTLVETGETTASGMDGGFAFPAIPTGSITLVFARPGLAQNQGVDGNNVRIDGIRDGDHVEVRCSMKGSMLTSFQSSGHGHPHSEVKAESNGLEAKIEIEHDEFEVEIEGLPAGTVIDVSMDGTPIGSMTADADGEAELEFEDILPLGALDVAELVGLEVVFTLAATGEILFTLTVPAVGARGERDDDDEDGDKDDRGEADLQAFQRGLEGEVEIRDEGDRQRFKMEAEHLVPGTVVVFLIEDPDEPGTFATLATIAADREGEAEISTQHGLAMPFGVASVSDLVGLEVRVTLGDGSDTLLLSGVVPALVAH